MIDRIYDGFATVLSAHFLTLPVARRPVLHKDFFRGLPDGDDEGLHVFLYFRLLRPKPGTGRRGIHYEFMAQYWIDCVATALGALQAGQYTEADERAGRKLRQLILDTLEGCLNYSGIELDQAIGEIGTRPFPQIDAFEPAGDNPPERAVHGARLTFDVNGSYQPGGATGEPMSEIGVFHPHFEADIETGTDSSTAGD